VVGLDSVNVQPFCPYCGADLARPPKRAAACPHCRRRIHVRTTQTLFPSHLVTEEQALAADWFAHLRANYGLTEEEYGAKYDELTYVFGEPAPPADVIMSLLDALAVRETGRLPTVCRDQARFVAERGADPRPWLRESMRLELELEYRPSRVVGGVRVAASRACCDECLEQDGDEYTIDEALRVMPLPYDGCSREVHDGPYPLCICFYQSVLKPPSEWGV
jgi:hypothetical protein